MIDGLGKPAFGTTPAVTVPIRTATNTLPRHRLVTLLVINIGVGVGCGARTAPHVEPAGEADAAVRDVGATVRETCDGMDEDGDGRVDEDVALSVIGERVRIRTDEMSTGDCSRCRWARSTRLVPTRSGMRALAIIFDEAGEVPNLYARSLGPSGRAMGSWAPLFSARVDDWFPSVRRVGREGFVVGANIDVDGTERNAIGELDTGGETTSELVALASLTDSRHTPDVAAWPDARRLVVAKCPGIPDVCLTRVAEGHIAFLEPLGTASSLLPHDRDAALSSPSAVRLGERAAIALLQSFEDDAHMRLLFFLVDSAGMIVRERAVDLPADAFRYRPFDTVDLLAADDGFFVSFTRRDAISATHGRWVARFDVDGALREAPTNFEPERFYYGAATHLQVHPHGGFLLSGRRALDASADGLEEHGYVMRLDARADACNGTCASTNSIAQLRRTTDASSFSSTQV